MLTLGHLLSLPILNWDWNLIDVCQMIHLQICETKRNGELRGRSTTMILRDIIFIKDL